MKTITPFILVIVAILAGFFFGKPMWDDVMTLRADNAQYQDVLLKGKQFDERLGALTAASAQVSAADVARLGIMIPSSVDNARLVLETNEIAKKYGTVLTNIHITQSTQDAGKSQGLYGTASLGFSVKMPYANFVTFLKALETNLRLVDVTSVTFTSADTNFYTFNVELKTNWLKPTIN